MDGKDPLAHTQYLEDRGESAAPAARPSGTTQNSPKLATAPFWCNRTVLFFFILMGFYGTLLVIRNGRIHQLRPFIITSLLLPIGFPSSFFCFFERLLLFFLLLLVGLWGEREREREELDNHVESQSVTSWVPFRYMDALSSTHMRRRYAHTEPAQLKKKSKKKKRKTAKTLGVSLQPRPLMRACTVI